MILDQNKTMSCDVNLTCLFNRRSLQKVQGEKLGDDKEADKLRYVGSL